MEKELQDYIERLKLRELDTGDVKKRILKIKRNLTNLFEWCEDEIKNGEITKQQLLQEFLEEYKKETEEPGDYQSRITFLLSQYESCKKILKSEKKDKNNLNFYINEAKKRENSNPEQPLYNSINMKEQINTTLRYAMRDIKSEKLLKREKNPSSITTEELLKRVHDIKNRLSDELKEKMISSIQKRVYFLEEYGYIDEYIESNNNSLEKIGLSDIGQVKRNPLPDVEYDLDGNVINTEEFEDMGVIDVFEKSNLKKFSPEELLVLELFWKSQYFTERLEVAEAFSAIEFLDLWPMIMDEDENAIENIEDEKLNNALKRDLALTYLVKKQDAITPELEEKYVQFLTESGMAHKGTTTQEIEKQASDLQGIFDIASELALGECVIIDKLKNKEIEAKNWGLVDREKFENPHPINEKIIMALEMPTFRGPLIFSLDEESIKGFLEKKDSISKEKDLKLPKYKGHIDEEYSKAMATLFLPTSVYFKKYITEKYNENPSSPLLSQLAINFAGAKKVKPGTVNKKQVEEDIR